MTSVYHKGKKRQKEKRKKTRRSPIEKSRKKDKNSASEKEWRARLSWKADLSSHTTRYADYRARGRIDADHMLINTRFKPNGGKEAENRAW